MSLELLISKYIDGELTQAEDAKLRLMLKDNPYAKDKFNQSVDLHLDLMDDCASIKVPDELLKKTEEAVMMKIFSAPLIFENEIARPKKIRKFNYRIPALAATIAFLALISFLQISDNDYPRTIDIFSSIEDNSFSEKSNPDSSIRTISNKKQNRSTEIEIIESKANVAESQNIELKEDNIILSNTESVISEMNEIGISATEQFVNIDEQLLNTKSKSISTEMNHPNISLLHNNPTPNPALAHSREMMQNNIPQVNFGFTGPEITSIQFNTIISRDFTRTGIETSNNTIIQNMSQSIGYNFNNNSTIGIEFGLTQLSYDYTKFIPLNINGADASSGMSVNSPSDNGGNAEGIHIKVPVRLQNETQFYWGMAFYDANIFKTGDFSLNGRIGAGATNDGPLGLGRLLAKYNIMNNLAFTIGAEGRIFMMKTPLLINGISTITSYGVVYGVQLNL